MNFKNLHEMSKYFEGMTHKGFDKHMDIHGRGNNGLGYKPDRHMSGVGGKFKGSTTKNIDKLQSDIIELLGDSGESDEGENDEGENIITTDEMKDIEDTYGIEALNEYLRREKEKGVIVPKEIDEYIYERNYGNEEERKEADELIKLLFDEDDKRKQENKSMGSEDKNAVEIVNKDYRLLLFINAKDSIEKVLEDSDIPLDEWDKYINTETGNMIEIELGQYTKIFNYLTKTSGDIINTSNEKSSYYTEKFKKYNESSKIKNLIDFPDDNGRDKNFKYKVDYLVNDYICQNTMFEIKALTKTYEEYKKQKFINLVSGKITGTGTEFKPFYKINYNDKNEVVNKQVENVYTTDREDNKLFNVYKSGNLNYIVIFVLSDGIFYYEPLRDDKFEILEDGRGRLKYPKVSIDDEDGKEYKIPTNKLIRLPQNLINSFLKK